MANTAAVPAVTLAIPQPTSQIETKNIAEAHLSSPSDSRPNTSGSVSASIVVPLDSPLRTTPIHPSLPGIRVPRNLVNTSYGGTAGTSKKAEGDETESTEDCKVNPITLLPFTENELKKYGFEKVRAQIQNSAAPSTNPTGTVDMSGTISRLRDETVAALRAKLEDRERKIREVEREMAEKEKVREIERKVFAKRLGKT